MQIINQVGGKANLNFLGTTLEATDYTINWNESDIDLPTSFILNDNPADRFTVTNSDSVEKPTIVEELDESLSSFWTHSENYALSTYVILADL